MNKKKSLQELTFKDNFMFGAVMLNPEICKGVLERSLGIEIERVHISKERSIVYNPEYKGIRLDAYAKDENNTRYDVEMQVLRKSAIQKRARYYHGQIDMEILLSGLPYEELPDTYVIFICDFDPFDKKKYRYTCKTICEEVPELQMDDGAHTVFLSTKGENKEEVPKELVDFLEFVGKPLSESEAEQDDLFIQKVQTTIREVKKSREMGARYMTFEELLKDERAEGRAEGDRNRLVSQVQKKLAKGLSVEEIAEAVEESVDTVEALVKEIEENK